jgi:Asp-tRNA(Asn)/Glu-tRNA(Gln) amidotransferase A subunit family amidase
MVDGPGRSSQDASRPPTHRWSRALRDAGAVVLGTTHMHEPAFGISGYNPAFKPPLGRIK